jgi:16S rRNA (cytidine1402-2'-O)-methyltransferase
MSLPGRLYLIPTPIGNLKDITYRAVETLKAVDLILAEDTRTSSHLLKHYEIQTPMRSYHTFNEHKILDGIIDQLRSGTTIGLITDAGTPGISDPGFLLIREALKQNIEIEALPGATAFVPAILKSGFPCDRFTFEGFLPHKKGRQTRLNEILNASKTSVLYESPHRLVKTLKAIAKEADEGRMISVSRELTKKFEETVNGTIHEVLKHFERIPPKGEFVIIIEGKK